MNNPDKRLDVMTVDDWHELIALARRITRIGIGAEIWKMIADGTPIDAIEKFICDREGRRNG
ncbi:hypothetical protein ACFFP0_31660 [Rhizobium puerariae]|uniref:Uncharacterized protein n=1 Tax=Rhizobium puerariae TaxID=1585791 RepID=A0ABV6AS17_9HYPH